MSTSRVPCVFLAIAACVVLHAGSVVAQQPVTTWSAEATLRITLPRDSASKFTHLTNAIRGPDGTLYVGDSGDGRIHIYSSAGSPIRTIGGSGYGPGRSTRLTHIGFVHDTLYSMDGQGVVNYFDRAGNVLGSIASAVNTGIPSMRAAVPQRILSDGTMILGPASIAMSRDGFPEVPIMHAKRDGSGNRTVMTVDRNSATLTIPRNAGGVLFTTNPFPVTAHTAVDGAAMRIAVVTPAELAKLEPGEYRVVSLTLDGDTLWSEVFKTPPRSIPAIEVDTIVARLMKISTREPLAEAEIRQNLYIPAVRPAVEVAHYAEDGTLWVKTSSRKGEKAELAEWDLIDKAGKLSGRVSLPASFYPTEIRGDDVIGIDGGPGGGVVAVFHLKKVPPPIS